VVDVYHCLLEGGNVTPSMSERLDQCGAAAKPLDGLEE
jgi:hypothetical protein